MKCKSIRASVLNEASSGAGRRVLRLTARIARQSVATLLSGLLVFQPMLVQAQVAPDTGAPIGNQPGVGAAPNGVPLVDIVTPNGQGLSHNKYNDFNVGNPGLILNNHNGEFGTSKLGGVTPGNANLKNSGPASVILNEVTSGNRSALQGATEVFGGRADVIIANPNGITCDGCGFINTPRATLTTGTPDIDGTGRLSGFTVQGGDVTFGSKGGNFASGDGAVDLFDIVSRRIQIDGPVNGRICAFLRGVRSSITLPVKPLLWTVPTMRVNSPSMARLLVLCKRTGSRSSSPTRVLAYACAMIWPRTQVS